MSDSDWRDPFSAEDPAAAERERRRAEREAKRRERQASLGEKAREAGAPAAGDGDGEAATAVAAPNAARTAAAGAAAAGDGDGAPPAAAPRRPRATGAPPPEALWRRRLIALVLLAAVATVIVIAVFEVADRIGGSDPPPPAPAKAKVQDMLVPEGLDRRQVAELADDAGLRGDYLEASGKAPKGFDPARYGAQDPPSLEGFLFPATYELPKNGTATDLVERQLAAFEDNMGGVDLSYAKSKNLTAYDVLIIASMIEREIQVPEERELAAAVIYNRLAAGDTLGIDATIRYHLQNYNDQLTESELADPHPYNTRINPGLPPTPIGNPGLASIEAAARPADSDAYYFVVKPGTCGEHVFVETEEEFAAAEASYQAALQAEGGSPTDCPG